MNGAASAKHSSSLSSLTQSWDSVIQTSSSLFSVLSFGTVLAKRSPLAVVPSDDHEEPHTPHVNADGGGRWILGGDEDGKRIWLEAGAERLVPISLGNQRPGFLREQSTEEDSLVEVELSVYKVGLLFPC